MLQRVTAAVREARAHMGLSCGGIVHFEHINLVVDSRAHTEEFFFKALGLIRDPKRSHGRTIWANVGAHQQFHLVDAVEGEPSQVVNGSVGLAVPSLAAVRRQLAEVDASGTLAGTKFKIEEDMEGFGIAVRCPYGTLFLVHEAGTAVAGTKSQEPEPGMSRFEQLHLNERNTMSPRPGIPYVIFNIPLGSAAIVAKHYESTLQARVKDVTGFDTRAIAVAAGSECLMLFVEHESTPARVLAQCGMHVCIYVNNFENAYDHCVPWTNPKFRALDQCDTKEQAMGSRQFRFKDIGPLKDGAAVFELEHETRAMSHSSYMQPLFYPFS